MLSLVRLLQLICSTDPVELRHFLVRYYLVTRHATEMKNSTNQEEGYIVSQAQMPVQIRTLASELSTEYFDQYHGELLLIVVNGEV